MRCGSYSMSWMLFSVEFSIEICTLILPKISNRKISPLALIHWIVFIILWRNWILDLYCYFSLLNFCVFLKFCHTSRRSKAYGRDKVAGQQNFTDVYCRKYILQGTNINLLRDSNSDLHSIVMLATQLNKDTKLLVKSPDRVYKPVSEMQPQATRQQELWRETTPNMWNGQ